MADENAPYTPLCGEDTELVGMAIPFDPETMTVAGMDGSDDPDIVTVFSGQWSVPIRTYGEWPYSSLSPEDIAVDVMEKHSTSTEEYVIAYGQPSEAAVDRTFENEANLNPRKAEDWVF